MQNRPQKVRESSFWATVGTKEPEVLNSALNQLGNQETSAFYSGLGIAFGEPYRVLPPLSSCGPKISFAPLILLHHPKNGIQLSLIVAYWQQCELSLPRENIPPEAYHYLNGDLDPMCVS